MMKLPYKLFLVILSGLLFYSCSPEDAVVDFTNPHDTKSDNYQPNSPGLLSMGYVNENAVQLTWTDKSLGEAGFIIERSDSVNGNFFAVDTAAENATSFLSKFAVKAGVNYYFRIRAYKSENKSAYSNVVSAILEFKAPAELRMVTQNSNDNSIEISWRNNTSLAKSILIQSRIHSEGTDFTTIAVLPSDKEYFIIKDLDRNKVYEFRAYAVSEHNTSAFTNILSVFFGFSSSEYQPYYSSYNSKAQEFSPINNHFLATGDDYYKTSFKVYDADLRKEIFSLPVYTGFAKYNPTGTIIAIGRSNSGSSADSLLLFVNAGNGRIMKGLNYSVNTFDNNSIDFTPDGSKIVLCSALNTGNNYIAMVDVNTYQQLWKVTGLRIKMVKMSSDGKRIFAVQSDPNNERILILNASDGSLINVFDPEGSQLNSIAFTKDGNYFAVSPSDDPHNSATSKIWIVNTNTLTVKNQIKMGAYSLEFTNDSKYLIAGNTDIRVFRLSDGFQVGTLSQSDNSYYAVSSLSVNKDCTYLTVSQTWSMNVLRIRSGWGSR